MPKFPYSVKRINEVADQLLDCLCAVDSIYFEVRDGRTISALHVATEAVVGYTIDSTAVGNREHTTYRLVAFAVRLLELLELIEVERACEGEPRQGDMVLSLRVAP